MNALTTVAVGLSGGRLRLSARVVGAGHCGGFHAASVLERDARFASLRSMGDFHQLLHRAERQQREALATLHACDGPRLLGLPIAAAA
jgi:hypothetical protein